MNEINNREELLRDLQFIKEAVKKNNSILKYIPVSLGTKNVALLTGLAIILFSLAFMWMIGYYGSYEQMPGTTKLAAYMLLGLCMAGLSWYKAAAFLKLGRRYRKDMKLSTLIKEVYTRTLLMIMVPFLTVIGVLSVYFTIAGLSYLIVPFLAILIALLMAAIAAVLSLKDFLPASEWLLASGLFSLFISQRVNPPLLLILTMGAGMLVLYVSTLRTVKKEKRG